MKNRVNERMNTNLCLFIGFEPQQHSNLDRSRVNDTSANKVVRVWVDAFTEKKIVQYFGFYGSPSSSWKP